MNTTARSILSTSTALGLASFTVTSAFAAGLAAPATILGFGFLAVYGLLEITVVSYTAPQLFATPAPAERTKPVVSRTPARRAVRVPALIEYPVAKGAILARAA